MLTQVRWMTGEYTQSPDLAANSFTERMNNLTFQDQL